MTRLWDGYRLMFVFQFDRGYRRLNTTLKNRSKVPNTVDPLQVFCKNHPHVLCHVEMSYLVVGRFRSWNLRIRLSWWPPPGTLLSALVNIGPHDFKIHYARREKLSSYPLARSSPWPMWDPESLHTPPLESQCPRCGSHMPNNKALRIVVLYFRKSA